MQLQLNAKEKAMFEGLGATNEGFLLNEFITRLCTSLVDIRNIPAGLTAEQSAIETKGRIEAVKILEDNFINRFKVMKGETEESEDNYE